MLTLEELMQPHIFRKPEHGNTSLPTSAAFGPSPSNINRNVIGLYNLNTSISDITPGTSTIGSHPDISVSPILCSSGGEFVIKLKLKLSLGAE